MMGQVLCTFLNYYILLHFPTDQGDAIFHLQEVFPKGQLIENVYVLRPTGFLNGLQKIRYEWSTSGDVHSKVAVPFVIP